jgi:hypothetical protein
MIKTVSFGKPKIDVKYPDINSDDAEEFELALKLIKASCCGEVLSPEEKIKYDELYPYWMLHYQKVMFHSKNFLHSA